MTPEQIAEVERLASLIATARVIRYRVRSGHDVAGIDLASACERVERAESALRQYLQTL